MSEAEKQKPLKIEVLDKISTLITAAFAFVAAFAWNETMKELVYEKLSDEEAPFIIIGYAVMITILAVVVTVMVARAYPELQPLAEVGTGTVRDEKKAYLAEIIEKVNDLFKGDLTDNDKLVYVNNVIKGKLLESETLKQQAGSNTKEQFATSPDLGKEILSAIMDALEAHETMSTQALASPDLREGLKEILLGPAKLYESLRGESDAA